MTRARETANLLTTQSVTGNINLSGIVTATDFDSSSDSSLKTDVRKVENALDLVTNLEGVKFTWISDNKPSVGVIAQQIEEYIPELVHTGDHKSVNYNGLIGILIEAVKELKSEVDQLKSK